MAVLKKTMDIDSLNRPYQSC